MLEISLGICLGVGLVDDADHVENNGFRQVVDVGSKYVVHKSDGVDIILTLLGDIDDDSMDVV